MHKTAISMEQQTVTIKIFLRIICPDIHLRRMTYPQERSVHTTIGNYTVTNPTIIGSFIPLFYQKTIKIK